MSSELIASYRSTSFNLTSFQASSQQQAVALQVGQSDNTPPDGLTSQQRQIIDDVSLSQEAQKKLQEGQVLLDHLQAYIDSLKGRYKENLLTPPRDGNKTNTITLNGRSTDLAASIMVASYKEETLEVAASFGDDGNLEELTITQTKTEVSVAKADFILQDRQFFSSIEA